MTTPLIFSLIFDDIKYAVEGDYTEGSPGVTSGPWENAEEPTSSEFDITSIKLDGREISEHELPEDGRPGFQNACEQAAEEAMAILRERDEEELSESWRD